jgi:hypothetical protein
VVAAVAKVAQWMKEVAAVVAAVEQMKVWCKPGWDTLFHQ